MYRATLKTTNNTEETDKQTAWAQLEEQMYRRWEILGVCHLKTNDRKLAFESFVNCTKAFPFVTPAFLDTASAHSISTIFDSTPALKHVASIIDRLTYTGVCDLLLHPQSVSLRPHFVDCYVPEDSPVGSDVARRIVIGSILERQAQSLDSCKWKDSGRKAIQFLLKEALHVYTNDMPIRRARVILKMLELIHSSYDTFPDACASYEDLGDEAESLLTKKDLRLDQALVHFRTRYRAVLKLRLALLVHREAQTSQFSKVVAYAEEACKILKSVLSATAPAPQGSLIPAQSPKATRTQASRRVANKGQVPTSRLPLVRARARSAKTATTVPVTPRKKRRKCMLPKPSGDVHHVFVAQARPSIAIPNPLTADPAPAPPLVDDLPVLLNLLRQCNTDVKLID